MAEHWFGSELLQQMALRQEAASADDRFASDKSRRPNIEIGEAHGSKREPPQAVQEGSLNVSFLPVHNRKDILRRSDTTASQSTLR